MDRVPWILRGAREFTNTLAPTGLVGAAVEHLSSVDPERLLAHTGWMRALAQSLLRDAGAADDVVQDATVAALLHAPARERELAPWLSRVVRNFARRRRRGERRRADREAQAGAPEPESGPADTLERLELQQTVVEAVRAIEEPLRTTLVLRYFEGKTSAEIARVQRVPAGTVRWRLARGLAELRAKLDTRFGSRASWALLFAPFARQGLAPASSIVLTGVLAMNAAQVGLAAAIVVLGGVAWWGFARGPATPATRVAPLATESVPADVPVLEATGEVPRVTASGNRGAPADSATAMAQLAPESTPVTDRAEASVDARFVDEHGAPWGGVRFAAHAVRWRQDWKPGEAATSSSDGRAEMRIAMPLTRGVPLAEFALVFEASRAGCATIERSATLRLGTAVHLGDVVLGPGIRIRGRAVDEHGDGVALASIGLVAGELTEDEGHMRRHGSDTFRSAPGAQSAADGSFVLDGVAPGVRRVWAHADGKRFAWSQPIEIPGDRDLLGFEIVLTPLLPSDRIEGRVVAPDDRPIADAYLWFNERSAGSSLGSTINADAEGRFGLLVQRDDSAYSFTAHDREDRFAATTVEDVHGGSLAVVIRMHEKRWLPVHVHTAEGGPIADAKFEITAMGMGESAPATSSAPGAYSIAVQDGQFQLEVSAPGFHTRDLGALDAATLPATLDVVMLHAPVVRGRVTANGLPITGARVQLVPDRPGATETVAGFRSRYIVYHSSAGAVTDADGRFRMDCDENHGFWLRVTADGWAVGEVGPTDAAGREGEIELDVELTKGGAIEGRVILPDGADGEGAIVALNHGDGHPRTLRAGAKGVFRVDGLAPGPWQVLAAQSEIDPASTRYSSISVDAPIEWSCSVSAGKTTHFDLDLTRR